MLASSASGLTALAKADRTREKSSPVCSSTTAGGGSGSAMPAAILAAIAAFAAEVAVIAASLSAPRILGDDTLTKLSPVRAPVLKIESRSSSGGEATAPKSVPLVFVEFWNTEDGVPSKPSFMSSRDALSSASTDSGVCGNVADARVFGLTSGGRCDEDRDRALWFCCGPCCCCR